ncbi:carboxyl-terminal protease [Lachnoclostridium sp. An169]|uniref:S41 family peptidase n=1 Tax=Lachnoclostridium sp. An169 TaxID=1965569 RepID=UPI000B3AE04B|nr:S41 family peptidase [Lachnoclostridium sp. An169]OUP82616.1 carboxyl-terminal protease [Lachnoclostridium sp. An169]
MNHENRNHEDENRETEGKEVNADSGVRSSASGGEKTDDRFRAGILAGLAAALVILICIWGVWTIADRVHGSFATGEITEKDVADKLDQLNALIDKYYLYEDEIDEDALIDGIYSGYAAALGDPYTVYYGEEETKALFESTSGEFSGIGATMSQAAGGGTITVTDVYEDSPADKAGMKAGDILCQVDDKPVDGESLETVVSWVKGEKGTEVTLYVERDGEQLELTAVRDTIEMQTVEYEMKEDQIGYIAVSEFDEVTYDQFKEALDDLENQGMEGLVIDLRNNPGGNLDTVTDMLRLLLPEGTIVSIKDKDGNSEELTCDGENEFTKPLAVLVNQYSASASEIFSAAIQDYGTGRIVGVTTYGKGVVQQLITLGDGTCLKLTIAEYFTPSGRSINGTGVEPDVEVQYVYDADNPEGDNQLDAAISTVREEME